MAWQHDKTGEIAGKKHSPYSCFIPLFLLFTQYGGTSHQNSYLPKYAIITSNCQGLIDKEYEYLWRSHYHQVCALVRQSWRMSASSLACSLSANLRNLGLPKLPWQTRLLSGNRVEWVYTGIYGLYLFRTIRL